MENVCKEYVEAYESLMYVLLQCGLSTEEANIMIVEFENVVSKCRELARKGGDPKSEGLVKGKTKKGGRDSGNCK